MFKLNKNNRRKEGEVHFKKLMDAEERGLLPKIGSRQEMALLAGYPVEESKRGKRGYSWVSTLIHRGYIKESEFGVKPNGELGYDYEIIKMPDYTNGKASKVTRTKAIMSVDKKPTSTEPQTKMVTKVPVKLEITRGDLTIKIDSIDSTQVNNLIEKIL